MPSPPGCTHRSCGRGSELPPCCTSAADPSATRPCPCALRAVQHSHPISTERARRRCWCGVALQLTIDGAIAQVQLLPVNFCTPWWPRATTNVPGRSASLSRFHWCAERHDFLLEMACLARLRAIFFRTARAQALIIGRFLNTKVSLKYKSFYRLDRR